MRFPWMPHLPLVIASLCVFIPVRTAAQDLFVTDLFSDSVLRFSGTSGTALPSPGHTGAVFASGRGYDHVAGLAFGPNGNLYVAGYDSDTILRYNGQTGAPLPGVGQSGAVFLQGNGLGRPQGLRFGSDGNLYVGQVGSPLAFQTAVLRFDPNTGASLPSAGHTGAVFALGSQPIEGSDLVFGLDGNLYVTYANSSDFLGGVIEYDGVSGAVVKTFVTAGSGGLQNPRAMTFGPNGDLFISSAFTNSVLEYDGKTGAFVRTFAVGSGYADSLNQPEGLAFGPDNNLYVSSSGQDSILEFDGQTGILARTLVPAGTGQFFDPLYLTFSPVPESGSVALLVTSALTGAGFFARRRKQARASDANGLV